MGSALPPASQAPKGEKKVNKTLMHNAYVYNSKGKRVKKSKAIKVGNTGKVIATYGIKTINGKKYYRVGENQYIASGNIDGTMRLLKKNAFVYNDYGNRDNKKVLKKDQSVATYGGAISIYGLKYYRVGIHQYIKKGNF